MDNECLHITGRERLTKALKDKGITAAELSKRTGLAKSTISRYLKGNSVPKQDQAIAMSKVLNVSPAWLMGYDVPSEAIDFSILSEKNQILGIFERMSADQRKSLINYAEFLIKSQEE